MARSDARKSSPVATILNFIGTLIIILVIALCLVLVVPKVFGYSAYTVVSGSMEPNVPVGSVIYAKATDPETLQPGDIIVFNDGRNDVPITHRVVENQTANGQVITKGDANPANDLAPIPYINVIGKVALHVPVIGGFLVPLGTIPGKIGILAVLLGAFLLCEIARRMRR